jgi:hypothetical protein
MDEQSDRFFAKVGVAGSNPVVRSKQIRCSPLTRDEVIDWLGAIREGKLLRRV